MRRWLAAGVAGFLVVLAVPTAVDAWQVNQAGISLNRAIVITADAAAADPARTTDAAPPPEAGGLLERSLDLMEAASTRGPHTAAREVPFWRTYGAAARMLPSDHAFQLLLRSRNAGRLDWYGELWLGEVASATGHWDEAAEAYRRVDVSNLLVHRAETHIQAGKKELALRELALAKLSLDALADREKARMLLLDRAGKTPSALAGMLQRPAERATTLSRIGRGLLSLGRPAEARPVLEQGLALAAGSSPGVTVERNLRFDLASVFAQTLPERPPAGPSGQYSYYPDPGELAHLEGVIRARALVYQALALERTAPTCARAGRILMQIGDEAPGLRLLTEAVERDPLLADGYLGLGDWYDTHQLGYFARVLYERAAALMPEDPLVMSALAVATFKTMSAGRALPLLEQALAMETTNPYVYAFLGDCYAGSDRFPEAIAVWEDGLRRFPDMKPLSARLAALETDAGGSE